MAKNERSTTEDSCFYDVNDILVLCGKHCAIQISTKGCKCSVYVIVQTEGKVLICKNDQEQIYYIYNIQVYRTSISNFMVKIIASVRCHCDKQPSEVNAPQYKPCCGKINLPSIIQYGELPPLFHLEYALLARGMTNYRTQQNDAASHA